MKIIKSPQHCSAVTSNECEAPAGYATSGGSCGAPKVRGLWQCDSCGGAVCKECSLVEDGVLRCNDCRAYEEPDLMTGERCVALRVRSKRGETLRPEDSEFCEQIWRSFPGWYRLTESRVFRESAPFGASF